MKVRGDVCREAAGIPSEVLSELAEHVPYMCRILLLE